MPSPRAKVRTCRGVERACPSGPRRGLEDGHAALERLESGEVATQLSGFVRVCRALDLTERLDLLVPEPVPSPLAQMKLRGRQRQRASGKQAADTRGAADGPGSWTWGEPK